MQVGRARGALRYMGEGVRKIGAGGNFKDQFWQVDAWQHAVDLGAQRDQRGRLLDQLGLRHRLLAPTLN